MKKRIIANEYDVALSKFYYKMKKVSNVVELGVEYEVLEENGVPQYVKVRMTDKKDFDPNRVKVFADTDKDLSEQYKKITKEKKSGHRNKK